MKIALDVMGFENDVTCAIQAAERFQKDHSEVEITLVGDEQLIRQKWTNPTLPIVHTDQFVTQDDTIVSARRKPNSSMQICANLLHDGAVDGLVSAGSTPIFVFTMYRTIGMLNGVKKPGFMPTFPTTDGIGFNMLDVGASTEVDPLDLVLFGIMGNEYAKIRLPAGKMPKVGILNIGTEEHKGTKLQRETSQMMHQLKGIDYVGFVEPNLLLTRVCDVVVTDGFTGNIALKAMEGSVRTFGQVIKAAYKKHPLAGLLSKKIFRQIKEEFNYKNYAGAFVLGLQKMVVKTHGSADTKQFYSALQTLYLALKKDVLGAIRETVQQFFLNNPQWNREETH